MTEYTENDLEQIAVIGLAGRFPEAASVDLFWQNLRDGKHSVTRFTDEELLQRGVNPDDINDPSYVKAGLLLDNIDLFDAEFFGYNAKDAEIMDPQQRIFLELAWEALEHAGCNPDSFTGSIGVFGGSGPSDYQKRFSSGLVGVASGFDSLQAMLGNDLDFLTTRISYKLNLTGPSFTIQTACSTSLVAVHVACQNLLTYQCDLALAGGVSIRLPQGVGYFYRDGMNRSPDGYCRAFDVNAQGTIPGRGAGIVVLKRLSEAMTDGDTVHAIIKGSAVNNDGSLKVGFTAPSVEGQYEVISAAQAMGGVAPDTIGYIEAHGTATKLGDPIEIEALTKAFRAGTDKNGFCGIGSVKTNIGHLDVASGIAGFIKTVLAVRHGQIPPSLHFEQPNPNIDFGNSPFYVADRLQPWKNTASPRRAGVSSFGIGGTNAHVIVEEASPMISGPSSRSAHLLLLSARDQDALLSYATALRAHFQAHPEISLADAAFTLQTGRKHFEHRRFLVCADVPEALSMLEQETPLTSNALPPAGMESAIAFMFSGQGSQYVNMCRGLYEEEPYFRNQLDTCAEILLPHLQPDLRSILFPADATGEAKQLINQTFITQPALFAVEYSLATLLMHWGIRPHAMVGHSIGEYVAACLAGVFSLEDALSLVAARGRMMQEMDPGSMLSVPLAEDELKPLLPPDLSIAVINAPTMTVVSGPTEAVEAFKDRISADRELECRTLHTSHAFHSSMMEPILEAFTQLVASIDRNRPSLPFASNLTGAWITETQAVSPEYWAEHLRHAVRFHACLATLLENGYQTFLEVGPSQVLAQLARQNPDSRNSAIIATTRRPVERKGDMACLLQALGQVWASGINVNWQEFHRNESRRKIPLPTYQFQRKRYWIETAV